MTDELDPRRTSAVLTISLPAAVRLSQLCEVCDASVELLSVRTAPGYPDFVQPIDIQAWLGWSHQAGNPSLELVVVCSNECLHEHWKNQTEAGA